MMAKKLRGPENPSKRLQMTTNKGHKQSVVLDGSGNGVSSETGKPKHRHNVRGRRVMSTNGHTHQILG